MKKMLWLASWYPSKVDPFTGDFIERHARAASLYSSIHVLHVVKDKSLIENKKNLEEKKRYAEGGEATIIYYPSPAYRFSWLEKLHSIYLYLKIHKEYLKNYIREKGKPDGIHVHIGLKAGIAGLFLKFWYQIPYLVSEHWSGLCPEAKPNYSDKPWFYRWLWKTVMKNASGYSAVSEYLAVAMQNMFSLNKVNVIPNVVDSNMFFPSGKLVKKARFIYISAIKNYQKNVISILEAAAIMIKRVPEFSLIIFGEPNETAEIYVQTMNLGHAVEFKGLSSQEELRDYIQEAVALILYSRFETFGCVILEANACGKPVIVSDIPVFHENVKSGQTGVFVPLDNPLMLADAMVAVSTGQYQFDPDLIQHWALGHYSFEIVGKLFAEFYNYHFK